MDTNTGAFYIWTIPNHDVKIHGIVVLENRGGNPSLEDVFDNSLNLVEDNNSDPVQIWTIGDSIVTPKFKYIVSYNDGDDQFTFGEARRSDYTDWVLYDDTGVDYISEFISGYKLAGQAQRDFQSNYVYFYSDNDSKYVVQGVWDYSNNNSINRWSLPQTINAQGNADIDSVIARRKIRGRGKTLQLRITSSSGEPFDISGWSAYITINGNI
jgi:hypothetical protein